MELIDKYLLVGTDGLFSKRGCPGNCQHCGLWSDKGCRVILEAPIVDAVEVVHGRWKFVDIDGWWFNECSICGDMTPNKDGLPPDWNYCPNCGAKMTEVSNE